MKCKPYLAVSVILKVLVSTSAFGKLPSFLKICHRSDPRLNDCIKSSVELLKPLLANGIPEIGVPSCEPLVIPEIVLNQGNEGALAIQSTLTNIKIYGPSNFVLERVKLNLLNNSAEIKLWLPHLQLVGHYTLAGKILMIPITGKGICLGNYSGIDANAIIQGKTIQKNNETYFNVDDFLVDFNIGHANIQLKNLFNGNEELEETMNMILNNNWKSLANEIKPALEEKIGEILKKISNDIYSRYPIDVLLPP